jgi:hypothetical protein
MKKTVLDMLLEYGNTQKEKEHMRGREVSYQFAPTYLTKCILTHTQLSMYALANRLRDHTGPWLGLSRRIFVLAVHLAH